MRFQDFVDEFQSRGAELSSIAFPDWLTRKITYMVSVSFPVPAVDADFMLPFSGLSDKGGEPNLESFADEFSEYIESGAGRKRAEQFCMAYRGWHYSLAPAEIETAVAGIVSKLRELAGAARALGNNS